MADIRVSDVKQVTPDRAALREIAERRAKELESHKDCPLVDGEDIGDETCDLALQYHFARAYLAATAPLLVKCRECEGGTKWVSIGSRFPCRACHGTSSVERADLAAIRKRLLGVANDVRQGSPDYGREIDECASLLLELVTAQAREIAELKGKANGTL